MASRASKFSLQEAERDGIGLAVSTSVSTSRRTREFPAAVPGGFGLLFQGLGSLVWDAYTHDDV